MLCGTVKKRNQSMSAELTIPGACAVIVHIIPVVRVLGAYLQLQSECNEFLL
jgi:hypothetical protein